MKIKQFNRVIALALTVMAVMNPMSVSAAETEGSCVKQEYIDYCIEICEEVGMSPYIMVAMIESESSGRMSAQNGNCIGLCQVNKYIHKDRAKKLGVEIDDAYGNIRTAVDYLMEISESYLPYSSEFWFVLDVYNTGNDKRAMRNYENGTVCKYASKILNRANELEDYYYKDCEDPNDKG